ncbi:hypothetical protein FFLO_01287 [Filobasidium floriforme]|uniref:Pheromone n=1 Tax=Filobasidium floriforme TaxID=5210 RepID=A0A8K0NSS1_9TREE|nr:hypothetical protein FFLO_01287 [Filobasidium floriforme]
MDAFTATFNIATSVASDSTAPVNEEARRGFPIVQCVIA